MRLQTIRPQGHRLTRGTNVVMKGMHQVRKSTDAVANAYMWDAGWDWTGWMQPGLDKCKALGANTVKISGPDKTGMNGSVLKNNVRDNMRRYMDYCQQIGLYVFMHPSLHSAAGSPTASDRVNLGIDVARLLVDYPNLIALEIWPEWDFVDPSNATTVIAPIASAVRAMSPVPLTVSFSSAVWPPDPTNSWIQAAAPYVDFYGFDPYQDVTHRPKPRKGDYAAMRASSVYKPYVISECGTPSVSNSNNWPFDLETRFSHSCDIGFAPYSDPDCRGAVFFCLTDFDTNGFGMYHDVGDTTPNSYFSQPFALWPSVP